MRASILKNRYGDKQHTRNIVLLQLGPSTLLRRRHPLFFQSAELHPPKSHACCLLTKRCQRCPGCLIWTTPVHSGTLLPPPPPDTTHSIMGDCSLLPFTQKTAFPLENCAAEHTESRNLHRLRSLHAQVHGAHPGRSKTNSCKAPMVQLSRPL